MYRLLIVTQDPRIQDMFASMEGWEALGFKPPRVRTSTADAMECLKKHHIDAIALENCDALCELPAYLDEHYPNLPVFPIAENEGSQMLVMRELSSLLSRLKADDSNDEYDEGILLGRQRDRWMKKVLAGLVPTAEHLKCGLTLYRCQEKPDVACVVARLALTDEDQFFSDRWHYGGERLETALRNFFGSSHDHMLVRVAVISPEEARVLCYPTASADGLSENAAYEYIQETAEQIGHYLGLSMRVADVRRVAGLQVLAADHLA